MNLAPNGHAPIEVSPRRHALAVLDTMVNLHARREEGKGIASASELTRLRSALREQLVTANKALARELGEKESYLLLFPLVVHLDEIVQHLAPDTRGDGWPLLQKDLFDTEKGGQLFYNALDELLDDPRANPVLFEMYAFCLQLGFRGRLADNDEAIQAYLDRIYQRLVPAPNTEGAEPPPPLTWKRAPISPLWYYALALMLIAAGWVAVGALSPEREQALRPSVSSR